MSNKTLPDEPPFNANEPYRGNINTLGPTPVKPSLDEDARKREAAEYHEFKTGEKSMKADARAAQRHRDAAGQDYLASLKAAGRQRARQAPAPRKDREDERDR